MIRKNNQLKSVLGLVIIVSTLLGTIFILSPPGKGYSYELKTFQSYDEILEFLAERYENYSGYDWNGRGDILIEFADGIKASTAESNDVGGASIDYSDTNIQVEGVDEPDIVKTDGTYLYIIANSMIYILKAYPAEQVVVLSEISLGDGVTPSNIFINGDHLVVFGNSYEYSVGDYRYEYNYYWRGSSKTIITIYDVSDRENPEPENEIEIDGMYFDSRMIGEYVYVIINEYSSNIYRMIEENETLCIPKISINNDEQEIPPDSIYYVDVPELSDSMTHVLSINILNGDVNQKSFMLGSSQSMYVSKNNIFLVYSHYSYNEPLIDGVGGGYEQKTIIHKISVDAEDITYAAQGEVPGRILNQFSMDEHKNYFRVATQVDGSWWSDGKTTNVYILDENLERVSEIENIAPGEFMHSARFMGDKAYLVTFKKVDPFFTLDLSDPHHPKIMGELKIPGYSDYLHPFDENHIIGIGKDTVEPEEGESWGRDFAWYQGIKIALFDVTDYNNPKEIAKIIIGDRGTDSPALYDHKAFLFDLEKELLVIPVRLCEISDDIKKQNEGYTGNTYGECTFQGAYVYRLNLEDGFKYKGRVTHSTDENKGGHWWGSWGGSTISRSLYIGETLYTISEAMVKMNNLDTIDEINIVKLV
ncbi:beta-propeller domain-containing protein [Thermoplasmatota archaeon]